MSRNNFFNWWRAASFYKPLSECHVVPEEWELCPNCEEKPRLWIYDNGEFAKCKCQDTYEKAAAEGMSIWQFHNLHNGDMTNWNHNDLRDHWNLYVLKMKEEFV